MNSFTTFGNKKIAHKTQLALNICYEKWLLVADCSTADTQNHQITYEYNICHQCINQYFNLITGVSPLRDTISTSVSNEDNLMGIIHVSNLCLLFLINLCNPTMSSEVGELTKTFTNTFIFMSEWSVFQIFRALPLF